ncbi:hypothetical protein YASMINEVIRUS_1271 [Yasminevirus sp. GU-2018]|uniref:YspA cpYpsA-related SLOG domain-containing protein n=1 Tax=Yasminevirus sp. GU-2018 TaxID=2420051 RepID=A0A5K0U9I2_9VIRU|nr:hypothetical protein YASMINEVIRUS_1271 [Yasminevirus sp. GU-2018]
MATQQSVQSEQKVTKKPEPIKQYILQGDSTTEPNESFRTRMAVVGYRNYNDYDHIKRELDFFNSKRKIDLIVSGGCTGVDTLAERWADENNVPKKILLPIKALGKRSYALRDHGIVDHSTHMIAFPSDQGRGTQITIEMAKKKNIKLRVVNIN